MACRHTRQGVASFEPLLDHLPLPTFIHLCNVGRVCAAPQHRPPPSCRAPMVKKCGDYEYADANRQDTLNNQVANGTAVFTCTNWMSAGSRFVACDCVAAVRSLAAVWHSPYSHWARLCVPQGLHHRRGHGNYRPALMRYDCLRTILGDSQQIAGLCPGHLQDERRPDVPRVQLPGHLAVLADRPPAPAGNLRRQRHGPPCPPAAADTAVLLL